MRIWSLVLSSRHIIHSTTSGPRLLVPPDLAVQAVAEIMAYEKENCLRSRPLPTAVNTLGLTLLPIFAFLLVLLWSDTLDLGLRLTLKQAGLAHAGLIYEGQWWRCVTALFLHADSPHLVSNLAALIFLAPFVARGLGSGLTWAFFLISGALGNAMNAWVQASTHVSLGASTAVFGLIGVLAGQSAWIEPGQRKKALLRVFGFGLGFLALLGAGGGEARVDLGAHFFGLLAGLGPGVMFGCWKKWKLYFFQVNILAALLTMGLTAGAWYLAINFAQTM